MKPPPITGSAALLGRLALAVGLLSASAIAALSAATPATVPLAVASSHRDSPFIGEDPAADNTDTYAFVSTESGRERYVTLLANYFPLQEPANGPNFYRPSDFVTYDINVDTDGDAQADLTYRFQFKTRIVDPGTYLYNTSTILPPPNPADPTSQYVNLNQPQSYTLRELGRGSAGNGKLLLEDVRTAPYRPGPKSINPSSAPTARQGSAAQGDTSVAYQNLAQLAVHTAPNAGGLRSFVGTRDEGFYVGLGTAFDLINPTVPGADGTSGFNVTTLAVEVPMARLGEAGDTDGIIGVWATASRTRMPVCNTQSGRPGPGENEACNVAAGNSNGVGTQVSRLANPLFNEFLDPIKAKDFYNATAPKDDDKNILPYILNPATAQGPNTLVQQLREFTRCTDTLNRQDQVASFMLGYPAGVVRGFPGNRETQTANPAIADLLRLNYNIPPRPFGTQDPMGVLNGDFAGFPNGRRVGDDSVDILLRLWGGELQMEFGSATNCALVASRLTDNVPANDVPYLPIFPYLGLPHEGFNHTHTHNQP
ncbi:MAG: DUF4331 domain-containing protein [Chloroflexota bacterium]|nr:DUF4331 domain-containing protein [Chloroflexota bacterium]